MINVSLTVDDIWSCHFDSFGIGFWFGMVYALPELK